MWKNTLDENKAVKSGRFVLKDEEYKDSCRITLEKFPNRYEITCGVYGAMCHTVYCGGNYCEIYDRMKTELQNFIDRDTTEDEELEFYEWFTAEF